MKKACFLFFLVVSAFSVLMADDVAKSGDGGITAGSPAVHIVYVNQADGEETEAYHIRTLASVLGSEEAARAALVYHSKHAASGFSAMLTPQQAADLSKLPGVLQVTLSRTLRLHSGRGRIHKMGVFP